MMSKGWQQSIAVTPFLPLSVATFATSSTAQSNVIVQGIKPSSPETSLFQEETQFLLSRDSAQCRRVVTQGSHLYIRSSPGGSIIGSLPNRTLVTLEGSRVKGWVRISSPVKGYVSATYLKLCAAPIPPTVTLENNVRYVVATGGLRVRQSPALNSPILGYLQDGQQVTVVKSGSKGWAQISSPIKGYVAAVYLKNSL